MSSMNYFYFKYLYWLEEILKCMHIVSFTLYMMSDYYFLGSKGQFTPQIKIRIFPLSHSAIY